MNIEELKRRGKVTTGEAIDALAANPAWVADMAEKRAAIEARAAKERLTQAPLLEDLRRVGVQVNDVWDLVNTSDPYPEALPVLMRHVADLRYPDRVRAGIARALAVKPAATWWGDLRALYLDSEDGWARSGLAAALRASATTRHAAALVELLSREEMGESRIFFLSALRRVGGAEGFTVIESLVNDPTLGKEATTIVAKQARSVRSRKS